MAAVSLTLGSNEYPLTVVDGTALTLSLSGPAGPTGPAGPNTVSTSTATNLTGYIYGNGTTVGGATAATPAGTANTLVLRNASGDASFGAINASSTITTTGDYATVSTNGVGAYVSTFGADAFISTSGINASISTSGSNADIFTSGDDATISTSGINASISTTGYVASIYTSGYGADIYTTGPSASISTAGFEATITTAGQEAYISTGGTNAYISTIGTNAYIQSRATFKLFNGTHTTTLSHSPTANRAIAFPNAAGTVALIDPSSGTQTFSGEQSFSTRPRSSAALTPANTTELITLADGDARYGATGLAGTSAISITSQITPQTIRSATLAVGLYHIRMVFLLVGTANTGTRHGYDFSGTATVRFFRKRASSPTHTQQTSMPMDLGLAESSTSAVVEGIMNVTVAGTFSMQAAQNTSHPDVLSVGASNHMIITPCPKGSIS